MCLCFFCAHPVIIHLFCSDWLSLYRLYSHDDSQTQNNMWAVMIWVTHIFPPFLLLSWLLHCIQTVLHILQVSLGYMLMLCVMSYNTWIFLGVIAGSVLGYFISFPLLGQTWWCWVIERERVVFLPVFKGSHALDTKGETCLISSCCSVVRSTFCVNF